MKVRRSYRMVVRAERSGTTRRRILDAAMEILFGSLAPITLNSTAARAGVSVQTILRSFGSQPALVQAAAEEAWRRVVDQRGQAPVGDLGASIKVLFIHYETYGDRLIQARAREGAIPELAAGLNRARADHRRWVARTYRPQLAARPEAERDRTLNGLVAVTDVYCWKLLRRDLGLDRREAEVTLTTMVEAVAGA
ncbi:MAG: TetR/AcrR family transcriptional regulator [Candidatus Dormibacteraeota bacterium]|nr:TetR/AcrR family transcriptional regulator [Candidatus Dormibacteraeota bacterium]